MCDRTPEKSSKKLARPTIGNRIESARSAWKKRRSPTGLAIVLADRIDFIPGDAWDELTRNSSWFLSREYLRVLDKAGPTNVMGRYAMAFDGDVPVAALMAQLVLIDGRQLVDSGPAANQTIPPSKFKVMIRDVANKTKQQSLAKIKGRVLVCGNLLSWGQHAVAISSDYPSELAWGAIAESLYRIRRSERLTGQTDIVMLKDFSLAGADKPNVNVKELEDFNYQALETDPNMVLSLPASWKSFEDYLESLASKYRKIAKKIVKDVVDAKIMLETVDDLTPYTDDIYHLYHQVQSKAAVRPVSISPEYLPLLAKVAGKKFRCTIAKLDEKVVGFITTLEDGDTCFGYYIGFDYDVNRKCPLYFRLLQVCVEDAIRFGCRRLSLGRTALDPKARLGATPEPTAVWLRHRQPVMNQIVRSLLGAIPHDEAPARSPFKNDGTH